MKKQETSIYTIAKEAGVSSATVSRVINQSAPVSEEIKQKVLDAVERLNYVPNIAARNLSTSTSTSIGVIIPDVDNRFFMRVLQGITLAADELGYNIILFNSANSVHKEHKALDSVRELRLCGIIIAPVSYSDQASIQKLKDFESRGVPVVLVDRELIGNLFDCVVSADEEGSFQAVSELIRLGHRKIALISGPGCVYPVHKRMSGYCRAMQSAGIAVRGEYVRQGDFTAETAYRETKVLCALPDPPTAIFSFNNDTTYGCLKAFGDLGLAVGRDISLIGFDDIEEFQWIHVDISAVSRDVILMGRIAMEQLIRRKTVGIEVAHAMESCISTELILRGSERYQPEQQERTPAV